VAIVSIDSRDATPIYAQLERALRAAVATGRLRPGDQLPTVRQLAVDLRVNANTVARVYAELERAGVLETRRGVGSFVSATPARAQPARERDRRLRAFVTRMLADADAAGFTRDDLLGELAAHGSGTAEERAADRRDERAPARREEPDSASVPVLRRAQRS
jgi:GntR family transcriptional regulator